MGDRAHCRGLGASLGFLWTHRVHMEGFKYGSKIYRRLDFYRISDRTSIQVIGISVFSEKSDKNMSYILYRVYIYISVYIGIYQ